ncbi:MAG: DUF86 domain-containing protein [Phycisphaerae bacterium]
MRTDDLIRLRHILDAAREAIGFVGHRHREDLDQDRQLVWALVKAIEIIGEAAYQLSTDARAKVPDIPWEKIIGMRHRLVHATSISTWTFSGRPCRRVFRRSLPCLNDTFRMRSDDTPGHS